MFVGAEFYNALTQKYDDGEQVFKQATDALSRLFEPMVNMTMLSGISSTIESATYSQTNPLFAIAGNIAQNYAGAGRPDAVRPDRAHDRRHAAHDLCG